MRLLIAFLLFTAWAAAVTLCDCRARRIPNSLVLAGLVAALIGAIGLQAPFGISLTQALIGMTLGFFAMMPFYALNLMGAADVKVFAVLGAWCGMHALLGLWLLASAAACLHALWLLAISRTSPAALIKGAAPTFEVAGKRSTPYAACLCVPAVAALTVRVVTEYVR